MQPEKKQLEILLMDYFRKSFPEFPKGSLVASESPDFIVPLKNRHQLGIELTRLNPENATPLSEKQQAENNEKEHLIELVRNIYENGTSSKLFVKFLFSDVENIDSERHMMVAVHTVNLIRMALNGKSVNGFFKTSISSSQLPSGLDEILIIRHPEMVTSVWERSNNLGISNDVLDDIRKSIRKKDEKLRLYQQQHLNYYWLLITTDRLRGIRNYNLQEKIMNHHFSSRFQHVFLFDLIKSDIFQLI